MIDPQSTYCAAEETPQSFAKRSISMTGPDPENPLPKRKLPSIVRSSDLHEINNLNDYIRQSKESLEEYINREKERIAELEAQRLKEAYEDTWNKVMQELSEFNEHRDRYFQQVEKFCSDIVLAAMGKLLGELDDSQKIRSAVRATMSHCRQENSVKLKVHPDQLEVAHSTVENPEWKLEGEPSLGEHSCRLEVPLGAYQSSFEGNVNVLYRLLEQSAQN